MCVAMVLIVGEVCPKTGNGKMIHNKMVLTQYLANTSGAAPRQLVTDRQNGRQAGRQTDRQQAGYTHTFVFLSFHP